MIGIVVVSHSPALAEAAVALALEMVPGDKPAIAVAAGAGEGVIGTDAAKVAEAIESVSTGEGVLVFMDLGSAVMSTELALEFLSDPDIPVKLTSAPFVEGLIAGIVRAAGGASLEDVESEARGALAAKAAQLGDTDAAASDQSAPVASTLTATTPPDSALSVDLELVNPTGLHARPASLLATAMAKLDATVTIQNLRSGAAPARADSTIAILTLGTKLGDTVRVTASGPEAMSAIDTVTSLVRGGFGELDAK